MPRRIARFENLPPAMIADVVRSLGTCRTAIVRDVLARTRPFSPTYRVGLAVLDTIDALAEALTGNRGHFHLGGSSPADARREARDGRS